MENYEKAKEKEFNRKQFNVEVWKGFHKKDVFLRKR